MSGVLPNDEAQTPRWGHPNSMVFSQALRVIGVVCSAWLGMPWIPLLLKLRTIVKH